MQKLDSVELAKYILAKVDQPTNHLKLQKLVYYVEAYHLSYFNESIIDDDFEAWVHGPVVRKVWNRFSNRKTPLYDQIRLDAYESIKVMGAVEDKISEEQLDLIENIISTLGKKSGYYLECMTHEELPWKEARKNLPFDVRSSRKISKETMKRFYQGL
jgi:uncharacterized phage-associated protein